MNSTQTPPVYHLTDLLDLLEVLVILVVLAVLTVLVLLITDGFWILNESERKWFIFRLWSENRRNFCLRWCASILKRDFLRKTKIRVSLDFFHTFWLYPSISPHKYWHIFQTFGKNSSWSNKPIQQHLKLHSRCQIKYLRYSSPS